MRLGTFFLRLLHGGQRFAAALLEMRQIALALGQIVLHSGNRFMQRCQRRLLECKFFLVGHWQCGTLLVEAVAPAGDDLQGTLRVIAIGQFDLQTLFSLTECVSLLIDAFLCLRISSLDSRQALLLCRQPHVFLLDALIGQCREFRPAFTLGIVAFDIGLPLRPVGLQLRQA